VAEMPPFAVEAPGYTRTVRVVASWTHSVSAALAVAVGVGVGLDDVLLFEQPVAKAAIAIPATSTP